MNKVIIIGRLTKDPELKYTPNGTAVCTFTLAVDRAYSNGSEKEADFIGIVVWNKAAEAAAQYLFKGSQCAVEGRIQISKYQDKDGNDRWKTEVVANQVKFLDSRKKGKNRQPESYGQVVEDPDNPFATEEIVFSQEEVPF